MSTEDIKVQALSPMEGDPAIPELGLQCIIFPKDTDFNTMTVAELLKLIHGQHATLESSETMMYGDLSTDIDGRVLRLSLAANVTEL